VATVVVAAALMGLTACTPSSGRFIDEVFSSVVTTEGLQYGSAPDENGATETLRLDLFQPEGDTRALRPAVIFIHGGGFAFGNRTNERANAQAFARRGYVAVSISYRLRSDNIGQAIVDAKHDAQAAVRWLRRNAETYRIDPNQIAAGGTSAGAITAVNVANNPEDPGTSGNPGYSSSIRAAFSNSGFGGYYTPGDPPIILFHGTADNIIAYQNAVNTCNDHRAQGNVCELVTFEGGSHGLSPHRATMIRRTAEWFYLYLGLTQ
jgi:acetyl esterase/lipase